MFDTLPDAASLAQPTAPIPISLLNRLARERLEAAFPLCWVAGEVSNLSYAASGHVYFSLKDSSAQARCVMFRSRAQLLGWRLENGQHIEARVLVTLYEPRGDFQLNVEAARQAGAGSLFERFLRLKDKLEREGLFSPAGKRPLPAFPRRVGIVTSPQAAALRDVLSTLERRAPQVGIVLYPSPVQGEGAGLLIARAIECAGQRGECDVLIVCRGGGSMEDLWAFNDEAVARAIRSSPLPVVSGIGHETDFTIADFAADQRAPTPTAAAELAVPERGALLARLATQRASLQRSLARRIEAHGQQLDWLARRLQHPLDLVARRRQILQQHHKDLRLGMRQALAQATGALADGRRRLLISRPDPTRLRTELERIAERLVAARQKTVHDKHNELARLADGLAHLNPTAVLARGYAMVADEQGRLVNDSRALEPKQRVAVFLGRGRFAARVLALQHDSGQAPDGRTIVSAWHPD
ncbi:exodeoxyribonuclease VII large subunit [Accumulibacter sp.]|uniref:exodeoxyribonuclease VII large subunit n=1 Tax=Accumulibacter sp. TaxID=2053492 RepID=UPI0038FC46D6